MMQRLASGWAVAAVQGVSPKTVWKWRDRHALHGAVGLTDRSSPPRTSPRQLVATTEGEIEGLRRQRRSGAAIARRLGRPVSTVGVVLRRRGLGRLAARDPRPPVIRYEGERLGEVIHIDTGKLGRICAIGLEHLHLAIDDASRLAYTDLLPDKCKHSALAFLGRAVAWFARHGGTIEAVMTTAARPVEAGSSPKPCKAMVRATSAHGLTPQKPMARLGASFKPVYASGPTQHGSAPQPTVPPPCQLGSATTTASDPQLSVANRPAAASSGTTSLAATSRAISQAPPGRPSERRLVPIAKNRFCIVGAPPGEREADRSSCSIRPQRPRHAFSRSWRFSLPAAASACEDCQ
jgi:hypothetical protein